MNQDKQPEALIFADDRPASLDDDLYQWAIDAEDLIRTQHDRIAELDALLKLADARINALVDAQSAQAAPQAVQPVATRYRFILNGKPQKWEVGCVEIMDNPEFLDAENSGKFEMHPLYTHPTTQGVEQDAMRYRWLRERDLEAVHQGGVFAGMTPENIVLNGEDLDQAVDASIAAQAKQGGV